MEIDFYSFFFGMKKRNNLQKKWIWRTSMMPVLTKSRQVVEYALVDADDFERVR